MTEDCSVRPVSTTSPPATISTRTSSPAAVKRNGNRRLLSDGQLNLDAARGETLRLDFDLVTARQQPDKDIGSWPSVTPPRSPLGQIDDRDPAPAIAAPF
jgi:hypothetical protein